MVFPFSIKGDNETNTLKKAKEILKDALNSYSGTLLLVSHDRGFLDGLTDRVYFIKDQSIKVYHEPVTQFIESYYGNIDETKRVNYPIITCGYIKDATRITVSYGRQRAGLFCVGGVCRPVPANNGLMINLTHSF